MAVEEFLLDEPSIPWVRSENESIYSKGYYWKRMSDGLEGRPYAHIMSIPRGADTSEAHFHPAAQFQIMLEGDMVFHHLSLGEMELHYTDASTAYGPFWVGDDTARSVCAVLRAKAAGITWKWDQGYRKEMNRGGRELIGRTKSVPWVEMKGEMEGVRRKVMFGEDHEEGPKAHMLECPPDQLIRREPAPHGEYQILVKGTSRVGNRGMRPFTMRYVVGDEPRADIVCGPEGATWVMLTFDETSLD